MITQIDFQILEFFEEHASPALDFFFSLITKFGDHGIFWLALTIVLLCFKKTRTCGAMMAISLFIGFLVGNIVLKNIIARPRPFIQDPVLMGKLIISPPSGYSCPSGHTLASFECAVAIFMNNKKWGAAALVLAALIGISRNYLLVHFPSDVLFGLVLGVASAIAAYFIFNKLIKTRLKKEIFE